MSDGDGPVFDDLEVAVAHWHVRSWGGAEYVATKLAEAVGEREVFTVGRPSPDRSNPYGDVVFRDLRGDLSLPRLRRLLHRAGRAAEYALWADVDWREYGDPDVVITSGSTTRAIITRDDALHVNYCHSTPRWFYDLYHDRKDGAAGLIARPVLRNLRARDQTIDPRVDRYLANSPVIARRLWKYYKRDSEVLYPPIDLGLYRDGGDDGYYLHLGRLDPEKGLAEVVSAFERSSHRLILAGSRGNVGDDVMSVIESAGNLEWRGFVEEREKRDLLANCRALVFNGRNEDFGIVPIEANASGKPVLARDEGFPAVFIEDGSNGFLHDGTAEGVGKAIDRLERGGLAGDPRGRVERFAVETFEAELKRHLVDGYRELSGFETLDGA